MSELLEKGSILLFVTVTCGDVENTKKLQCIEATDNCPNEYITFYLYTKETQDKPVKLSEDSLENIKFANTKNLKILIHGVSGFRDDDFNLKIREAYFLSGEYNIITVDYKLYATSLKHYDLAIRNLPTIAKCVTQFLDAILDKYHHFFENVHAVGFSLGAQIAGYVGKHLTNDKKLYRVTGIDPALPNFESLWNILTEDSAIIVDVIHSNCGAFGQLLAIGTVDFYANGIITQPGCKISQNSDLCSHWRAVSYFIESITHGKTGSGFYATYMSTSHELTFNGLVPVPGKGVLVGEYLDPDTKGIYVFETNDEPPYAQGEKILN